MTGSIRIPKAPLERGSITTAGYRSIAVGTAAEMIVGVPSGVLGVMNQARKAAGAPALTMLRTASSVLDWVGSGFAAYSAWQEMSGVRQEWARVRRRGRLGMTRGRQVINLLAGGGMTGARAVSSALPVFNAFGSLGGLPIGPVVSVFTSTVKVMRTATDLAAAARFSSLVSTVKAKRGGSSSGPMLTVLDRLRGEVSRVVETVVKSVSSKLRHGPSASQRAQLLADARDEIFWILQDRVGQAAAAKLITLATENSAEEAAALAESGVANELDSDPVAKLRTSFDGIQKLYDFLLSHHDQLRHSSSDGGVNLADVHQAKDLADALIHALRQDASLFRKQSTLRFCLAAASFLGALLGLAALFTPAGPIVLLVKAGIGLSVALITLAQTPWDLASKRSADIQPLSDRVRTFGEEGLDIANPHRRPHSEVDPAAPPPRRGRRRPHLPQDLRNPDIQSPADYSLASRVSG